MLHEGARPPGRQRRTGWRSSALQPQHGGADLHACVQRKLQAHKPSGQQPPPTLLSTGAAPAGMYFAWMSQPTSAQIRDSLKEAPTVAPSTCGSMPRRSRAPSEAECCQAAAAPAAAAAAPSAAAAGPARGSSAGRATPGMAIAATLTVRGLVGRRAARRGRGLA